MHLLKTDGGQHLSRHRAWTRSALQSLLEQPGLYPEAGPAEDAGAAASPFHDRFRRELAWLGGLPGITAGAAPILAARMAASQAGQRAFPGGASALAGLLAGRPRRDSVLEAAAALASGDVQPALSEADLACLEDCWDASLAVEALLASGGDERLTLDPDRGLNRYGCAPWPRPAVLGFASCTASSLSQPAFVAAERARRALITASLLHGSDAAVAQASTRVADEILAHFDVADLAQAVLAASGTDAALIVTGLLAAEHPAQAITSVLVSPAETGSGVPDAVQGRHFAGSTPSGRPVAKGGVLEGLHRTPRLVTIDLRDAAGAPRGEQDVAHACEQAVLAALPHGRVVLHAIDGSKTGLAAPGRPALLRLAARFGGALDIVVDACQARIEPALVRWYLQQGFPVLVTGSKFFAAPGFCGAVLFPHARLSRIALAGGVPGGLAPYANLEDGVGSRRCPGLVLRWTAALHDMAAFRTLPDHEAGRRLDRLGAGLRRALGGDGRLRLIAAPRPDGLGWSDRRSVFTFAVRTAGGWMDAAGLRTLYLALQDDLSGLPRSAGCRAACTPCQLGQPVQLGSPALGGLRVAFSAAQVASGEDQADALACVFDKLRLLLDARPDERGRLADSPALAVG